jgi:hypothetical protein
VKVVHGQPSRVVAAKRSELRDFASRGDAYVVSRDAGNSGGNAIGHVSKWESGFGLADRPT